MPKKRDEPHDYRKNPVLACNNWTSNAELIADCAKLGYLKKEWITLDPTYGDGIWWKKWRPDRLVTHDLKLDGTDFRHLDYDDETFEAIAYDAPYVAPGGRETTKIEEMYDRYGMAGAPKTPKLLQHLINDGLTEMNRLIVPGHYILAKCQDYTSSGHMWLGTLHTANHGLSLGLELWDRFEHWGGTRPQPARTRKDGNPVVQQHARRNLSTMLVFRKKRPRR